MNVRCSSSRRRRWRCCEVSVFIVSGSCDFVSGRKLEPLMSFLLTSRVSPSRLLTSDDTDADVSRRECGKSVVMSAVGLSDGCTCTSVSFVRSCRQSRVLFLKKKQILCPFELFTRGILQDTNAVLLRSAKFLSKFAEFLSRRNFLQLDLTTEHRQTITLQLLRHLSNKSQH